MEMQNALSALVLGRGVQICSGAGVVLVLGDLELQVLSPPCRGLRRQRMCQGENLCTVGCSWGDFNLWCICIEGARTHSQ